MWLFYLMCKKQNIELKKVKKQRNIFQTKQQEKSPDADLDEAEKNDLPDRKFKITVLNMLIKGQESNAETK